MKIFPAHLITRLTGLNVDIKGWVLFAGEQADYDSIITILSELLHLFHSLNLFGGRSCLLIHVVNNAYRERMKDVGER